MISRKQHMVVGIVLLVFLSLALAGIVVIRVADTRLRLTDYDDQAVMGVERTNIGEFYEENT